MLVSTTITRFRLGLRRGGQPPCAFPPVDLARGGLAFKFPAHASSLADQGCDINGLRAAGAAGVLERGQDFAVQAAMVGGRALFQVTMELTRNVLQSDGRHERNRNGSIMVVNLLRTSEKKMEGR